MTSRFFHAGERLLQESVGLRDRLEKIAPLRITESLSPDQQQFLAERLFVAISTVDASGRPWATIISGEVGFIRPTSCSEFWFERYLSEQDPADAGLVQGGFISVLAIDQLTRQRLRINGRIVLVAGKKGFGVSVTTNYVNCAKYIVPRSVRSFPRKTHTIEAGETMTDAMRDLIAGADTFFLATCVHHSDAELSIGADVNHRGGQAGFVEIEADGTLSVVDYTGNNAFNSLGNILQNPKAGMLFVDFPTGTSLQMTGTAAVAMESDNRRRLRVKPGHYVMREGAFDLKWEPVQN